MFAFIKAWIAAKGGFAHVVAATYLTTIALYAGVPAFAHLLNSIYAVLPASLHELLLALFGVVAWYTNMRKSPPTT